jgi:hypothetical protein
MADDDAGSVDEARRRRRHHGLTGVEAGEHFDAAGEHGPDVDEAQPRDAVLHDEERRYLAPPANRVGRHDQSTAPRARENDTRKAAGPHVNRRREIDFDGECALIDVDGSRDFSDDRVDGTIAGRHIGESDSHAIADTHECGARLIYMGDDLPVAGRLEPE